LRSPFWPELAQLNSLISESPQNERRNSMMKFAPATKEQANLRLAIFGLSGSGKTFTSLNLAQGLGGKVAVIDTERGSASKYADRFTFDTLDLPKHDIDTYCKAIDLANKSGYAVLIIDSLTHGWHELVDEVERLARAKYRGNTWSAWSEGTPKQRHLVDEILSFKGHVIATMRTKTEWAVTTTQRGKVAPKRVGLAPQQGKGIEYEFDLLMEISPEHVVNVLKDRTGKFQDRTFDRPGPELGKELAAWLSEGSPVKARAKRKARPKQRASADNGPDWESAPGQDAAREPEVPTESDPPPEPDPPPESKPPRTKRRAPSIFTPDWKPETDKLAGEVPHYQTKDGTPNPDHMARAALKLGHVEITDYNLPDVIADLRQYALDAEALRQGEMSLS
jgi:hypothetical protein